MFLFCDSLERDVLNLQSLRLFLCMFLIKSESVKSRHLSSRKKNVRFCAYFAFLFLLTSFCGVLVPWRV
jgi:hypothetical protein